MYCVCTRIRAHDSYACHCIFTSLRGSYSDNNLLEWYFLASASSFSIFCIQLGKNYVDCCLFLFVWNNWYEMVEKLYTAHQYINIFWTQTGCFFTFPLYNHYQNKEKWQNHSFSGVPHFGSAITKRVNPFVVYLLFAKSLFLSRFLYFVWYR